MIAFGLAIAEPEPYDRFSAPGIRRAAEPDSEVYVFGTAGLIARTYNLILDAAAGRDDLEALALVHPHVELDDADFCAKVRAALSDPGVAVVGNVGGTGFPGMAWWRGSVRSAPVVHRWHTHGGGHTTAFAWAGAQPGTGEVDAVDGFLMVLSPWAVRNLRFDESMLHGYGADVDLCFQARSAGRTVVVADLRATRHQGVELIEELELWVEAHKHFAEKWEGRWPGGEPHDDDWRRRARRAEAERGAARVFAYSCELLATARVEPLERAMAEASRSPSWRLTAPLRRLKRARASALERRRRSA